PVTDPADCSGFGRASDWPSRCVPSDCLAPQAPSNAIAHSHAQDFAAIDFALIGLVLSVCVFIDLAFIAMPTSTVQMDDDDTLVDADRADVLARRQLGEQ